MVVVVFGVIFGRGLHQSLMGKLCIFQPGNEPSSYMGVNVDYCLHLPRRA